MKARTLGLALIPTAALAALVVAAANTDAIGWYDVLWLTWVGIFAAFEGHAIANETDGDTLSERTREWFRTKTPAGRVGFTLMVLVGAAWLVPHIILG